LQRKTVASRVAPVVRALLSRDTGLPIRFWDGSVLGPDPATAPATLVVRSRRALRRLLWSPDELGLARAYVAGDLEIDGDIYAVLDLRQLVAAADEGLDLGFDGRGLLSLVGCALQLGAIGPPPAPPAEELRPRGVRHSRDRDRDSIQSHYDVSNDFYRLVLGPSLTYSCAYWDEGVTTLQAAQEAKYHHIARKLDLQPGQRLLDVGCGWGGMVLHAARYFGVSAVGITLSAAQHELARRRVREAGLSDRVEIRLQDYRDLGAERFDAVSSIGMFEHVGESRLRDYAGILHGVLRPGGRLLNHGISRPAGPSDLKERSFINRYVFPDGELHEVGRVVSVLQESGLEVRDVEALREHYALTLRAWVTNLEAHWDEAVRLVGPGRARVWRLYMAGCALNFEEGRTLIHQVLGVRPQPSGVSGMPATRRPWYTSEPGTPQPGGPRPDRRDVDVVDLTDPAVGQPAHRHAGAGTVPNG